MCLYLTKRDATYYFRRVIPAEFRDILGLREFTFSLGTKDKEVAKRLRSEHALRTDELLEQAGRDLAASRARGDAEHAEPPSVDDQSLPAEQTEAAAFEARKAAEQQVRRKVRRVDRDEWREKLHGSTERLPRRYAALRDLLREREERAAAAEARVSALEAQQKARDLSAAQAGNSRSNAPLMLDKQIVDLWAAERKVAPKGRDTHRGVARWFYERVGEKPVAEISRADVLAFKNKLLDEGQSPANIKMKLSRLRTLLNWAFQNDHAPANVAEGIVILDANAARNKRKPFDPASLNAIFSSPVYALGDRPTQGRGEAAYWLPLLALFTGARMEELGQLRPDDVTLLAYPDAEGAEQSSWFIKLTEDVDDGLKLKNAASERLVPVHPKLERLGFIAFAQSAKDKGRVRIFHELKPGAYGRVTAKWGEWFSRYLRTVCLVTDRRMVFHSFRHTFKDCARHAGLAEGVQRQLMGHSGDTVADDYGSGHSLYRLVEGIKLYSVPGLRLAD